MTTLKAKKRESSSKGKHLRRVGYIPAIVYGRNLDASIPIQIDSADALKLIKHSGIGSQIEVNIDGETYNTMLKDMASHPVTYKLMHLDFQVLTSGEKVSVSAHLNIIGKESLPPDAVVQEVVSELTYTALPKDLIDHIDIDISAMTIGDTLHLKDLPLANDERYSFSDDLTADIVHVSLAKMQAAEEDAESVDASAEVPVIGAEE